MNDGGLEVAANGDCPQPFICPLSTVRAGTSVKIKQLSAPPEVKHRLREMGFCEEQKVRLLAQQANIICQVCNVRLGISTQLAKKFWSSRFSRTLKIIRTGNVPLTPGPGRPRNVCQPATQFDGTGLRGKSHRD